MNILIFVIHESMHTMVTTLIPYRSRRVWSFASTSIVLFVPLMAEKTVKKFEEELNCSICFETYTDPRLLQCFHAYCRKCLVKLVERDQQGQLILTCPTCRHNTPVPANGTEGLQPAFQINHFLEIMEEHKKAVADAPANGDKAERDSASLTFRDKVKVCCREHTEKEVELFCETCGEPVCVKCVIKGGKHNSHDCNELDKAFERYKVEVTASLEPMEKQVTTITKALAQLDARCAEISKQQTAVETDVHTTFGKFHHILDTREIELIGQLHHITKRKLKELAVQKDQLETTLAQLSSCLGFMKESLKTGSQEEVLSMKASVNSQVKELTTTFPPDMLKPNTDADIIFCTLSDISTICQTCGSVSTRDMLPDPPQCHASGKGLEVAVVGETATADLQAVNFKGQPCHIQSSACELVSELTGTRTQGSVVETGPSQYEISYRLTIKGRHQLNIKVESQHIGGSPFTVSAVEKLGIPILTWCGMRQPWGVAVNDRGEVIVTECGRDCICQFSSNGKKLRTIGVRGPGQGQLERPRGIAVDNHGNIIVADNHRIQKFTAKGQFLIEVSTIGNGPLQFVYPNGIFITNRVYITDSNNHRVQILNPDLSFFMSFGKRGSGKGQFDEPHGITCDSSGSLYVADSNNHRIQVFTEEGKFLSMFGRCGDGRGELMYPVSVAVDSNSNMVYVVERDNHRVSVFTPEGGFVTVFGSPGMQPGQFIRPHGIVIDKNGVVYVCDLANNRVQVF